MAKYRQAFQCIKTNIASTTLKEEDEDGEDEKKIKMNVAEKIFLCVK